MLQLLVWNGHDYPWDGPRLPTHRLLIHCAIAKPVTEPLLRQDSPTILSILQNKELQHAPPL